MADTVSPLTQEHLMVIKSQLNAIDQAEKQVELAKRAGIDVSDAEQRIKDTKAKLLQIKNVYFPGA